MECYCEPGESDDYADVWNVMWRKAKKQHKCCECLEPINAGDRYEYIFSVCCGDVSTYKTCEFCAKEYEAFSKRHPSMMTLKGFGELACRLVWEMRNAEARP